MQEEWGKAVLKLYHGSNLEIITIDMMKCRPHKDFGRGFYLTNIQDQAVKNGGARYADIWRYTCCNCV